MDSSFFLGHYINLPSMSFDATSQMQQDGNGPAGSRPDNDPRLTIQGTREESTSGHGDTNTSLRSSGASDYSPKIAPKPALKLLNHTEPTPTGSWVEMGQSSEMDRLKLEHEYAREQQKLKQKYERECLELDQEYAIKHLEMEQTGEQEERNFGTMTRVWVQGGA